ncbi:MAG: DUF2141 domain-containing protein [Sphingomonas sp.]|jgi:uncharacterized protein (DUF2141 family)|uniref:DUF2141 domain-containing protein n=1 Tax=unclassified Sphingomonas TaxID=196159 RepID=UPI0009DCAE62|nr:MULTISPECIES: DUF2141 domain-containing protein [unclassified Sphingomonas]MDR6849223.1 uncharacterized protein (DUF2141 family) [Sphingomonas sp. BE137]MDR7259784.1 uncharacterized protein (DUF2141 family) [Sphingomonas sp. BE270]
MKVMFSAFSLTLVALAGCPTAALAGGVMGADASHCASGRGPAIQVNVSDLKDRTGLLRLELYPANDKDFMRPDMDLLAEGKIFRRVTVDAPNAGPVSLCIRVPHPGRYALLFLHSRRAQDKFDFWKDGVGLRSNARIGRARPRVDDAAVDVGNGVAVVDIKTQYLRGLGGFGPSR